jgi:uncharacterized HhH-GPD family protein
MAKRLQTLTQFLVEQYDGKVESIWKQGKPDCAEVLKRLTALPGFGDQKARIFLALLGKQLGVRPRVPTAMKLGEVRAFKKAAKAAAKG